MKKVASIFAVVVMATGMISCEAETNLDDTDAVYELNIDAATDGDDLEPDVREG